MTDMRLLIIITFALASASCGWTITHCTYWNILPAFGIMHNPDVCPGGMPTQTVRPTT